jgi:putative nucleotidyltransferase with HDIG domain
VRHLDLRPEFRPTAQTYAIAEEEVQALEPPEPTALVAKLTQRLAADVGSGKFEIPELPRTVLEIQRFANSPNADFRGLVRIVDRDPTLAARILRLASSAAMGGSTISEIPVAISRLGIEAIRDLAFAVSMGKIFRSPALDARMREEHRHGFAVAAGATALTRGAKIDAPLVFLCGLLHDIGRCALLAAAADYGRKEPAFLDEMFLDYMLRELHTRAGALVLGRWQVNAKAKMVAEEHHERRTTDPKDIALLRAVAVADAADELTSEAPERLKTLAALPVAKDIHPARLQQTIEAVMASRKDPELEKLLG